MVLVESYPVAVLMCIITMICWGSWANTQKLASKEWRFQLFYWDYCLGVLAAYAHLCVHARQHRRTRPELSRRPAASR